VSEEGKITTKVFRKDIHRDQYLNFNSNHPLEHKRGVINTLMYRAVATETKKKKEKEHIKKALKLNGYPEWMFKDETKPKSVTHQRTDNRDKGIKKPPVIIPYVKGVSEKLRAA